MGILAKNGQLSTDLTLPRVIESIYSRGLVESKVISINSVWSAIKITWPIKGKKYKNHYGLLSIDNLQTKD